MFQFADSSMIDKVSVGPEGLYVTFKNGKQYVYCMSKIEADKHLRMMEIAASAGVYFTANVKNGNYQYNKLS